MILLYIDPGTGSMLFTILLGVVGAAIYALRTLRIKLSTLSGRKRTGDTDSERLVIFSDHKRYWNVFAPICEALEKQGTKLLYLTMSKDDPVFEQDYQHIRGEYIGEGNQAFARLNMLRADLVLSTTPGLDVLQWKRSKHVKRYVHIPHAPSDLTAYRMFGIDFYDAIMVSGEYHIRQIRALEAVRGIPEKEIEIIGIPYMDEMKKRLDLSPDIKADGRTILLAPSWGSNSILNRFGERFIDALIKTGYHLIIRPHPQSYQSEKELIASLKEKYPESDKLSWNRDNDNFEVLRRADILISDFSGVLFEYALVFDKPIIYADTSFDKAPLDCYVLDEELWTFQVLPKIGRQIKDEQIDEIKSLIDRCIEDEGFAKAREEARDETWMYRGEGTERCVAYLNRILADLASEDEAAERKTE